MLSMFENRLTGSLPASLGSSSVLASLWASQNLLKGSVPSGKWGHAAATINFAFSLCKVFLVVILAFYLIMQNNNKPIMNSLFFEGLKHFYLIYGRF